MDNRIEPDEYEEEYEIELELEHSPVVFISLWLEPEEKYDWQGAGYDY